MTDLDRVWATESELVPSSGFASAVMSAVRDEAERPPIPFPWNRFALGLGMAIVAAVIAALWIVRQPAATLAPGDMRAASSAAVLLATTAGSLIGTIALLRVTRILLRD